jgi:hypothetical protein
MRSTDAIGHNRGRQSRSPEADYRLRGNVRLALDVFNLFDAEASDIDYLYTSRLPGEPADGPGRHPLPPDIAAHRATGPDRRLLTVPTTRLSVSVDCA